MTLFFMVLVLALFAMVGLVVDGGTKIRAVQEADAVAAEAARAGGQAIGAGVVRGDRAVADPDRAVGAARAYLREAHIPGTVRLTDGGRRVAVAVSVTRPTIFLGLIGIGSVTVTGHGGARLVRGVSEQEPT